MKIKLTKDYGDYVLTKSKTQKLVDILEKSEQFEKIVLDLRKKYNVPEDFYTVDEYYAFTIDHEELFGELLEDSRRATRFLKLPQYIYGCISYFVLLNLFPYPERVSIEIHSLGGFMTPNELIFHKTLENGVKDRSVFIEITEKISREQLHRLIDQEWEDIEKGMDLNLFEIPQHKMARASLAKRIVEMRDKIKKDNTQMKFGEIANVLQKENKDNDLYDVLNEDYVKNLYHRWKNKK